MVQFKLVGDKIDFAVFSTITLVVTENVYEWRKKRRKHVAFFITFSPCIDFAMYTNSTSEIFHEN